MKNTKNKTKKIQFNHKTVNSTVINSIAYDIKTKTLELRFQSDSYYQYYKVPIEVVFELERAQSVGTYFNKNIRNIYKYKLIKK